MEMIQSEYENLSFKAESPFLYLPPHPLKSGAPLTLRWHEQMEIKYILSGTLDVVCGAKVIRARPGDVVIINPCERHANQVPDEHVSYHLLMVNSVPETFGSLAREYAEGQFGFINLIRGDDEIVEPLLRLIGALNNTNPVSLTRANGWFLILFSNLCQYYRDMEFSAEIQRNRRQEMIVETAMNHIYRHYSENIRVSDIATKCYVSDSHLCRVFKEVTGKTPVTYLLEFRINKATILLENSDLPVADIGDQVGFSNPSYFCRCFRRLKGMTPYEFRRINRDKIHGKS